MLSAETESMEPATVEEILAHANKIVLMENLTLQLRVHPDDAKFGPFNQRLNEVFLSDEVAERVTRQNLVIIGTSFDEKHDFAPDTDLMPKPTWERFHHVYLAPPHKSDAPAIASLFDASFGQVTGRPWSDTIARYQRWTALSGQELAWEDTGKTAGIGKMVGIVEATLPQVSEEAPGFTALNGFRAAQTVTDLLSRAKTEAEEAARGVDPEERPKTKAKTFAARVGPQGLSWGSSRAP